MRDPCVFCSGEACPGSCKRTKKAESPTQGAPPPAPTPKAPKLVSRSGGAMSSVAQRLFQQHQQRQTRAAADPRRTLGKAEIRAHALSFVGRQARHLPEAELVAGAAHHLVRLHKAVREDNRVVAARHAHAYSIYERLLGHVPSDRGSAVVEQRCRREGASLVKSELKAFESFRRDEQVREMVLWSETLEKATKASTVKKALPAPDPQGSKIPKLPVAGAPIAAERKAKFGNKTSATAPTAAPTPKPPSMPTKATTKAPKVPAAPKPVAAPKAQSSGSR